MTHKAALAAAVVLSLAIGPLRGDATNSAPSDGSTSADPLAPYEHWITGDVFTEDNALLFHADRPVTGNSRKNVVVLAVTREVGKVLLPLYVRAAERHVKLRLFGALIPHAGGITGHPGPLPSVEFLRGRRTIRPIPTCFRPDSASESMAG